MVFSSPVFLFLFLPIVFIVYRIVPSEKGKNYFLAISSIFFYAFGQLTYVPLFLISVCINFSCGCMMMRNYSARQTILKLAIILNLGILAVFKYTDFLLSNFNHVFHTAIPLPGIVLPIGISFFTFQGLSYVIDVYRDPQAGTFDFFKVLLYIDYFPQLIAGPIVKYHDISAQIDSRSIYVERTAAGLRRFIVGLAKKVLIANSVGAISDQIFSLLSISWQADARLAWLGAICYTLQIYYDFSGYSDMAIGIGHMFGFSIAENFDHPYSAYSVREFWRRWHISLSTWFREYVYIPLGGNRKGKGRTILNRMMVFLLTGIWHGANWTFIVWGICHGVLSNLENIGLIPVERLGKSKLGRLVNRVYLLLTVTILFVIFRADNLDQAWKMIFAMFSTRICYGADQIFFQLVQPASIAIISIAVLFAGNIPTKLKLFLQRKGIGFGIRYSVLNAAVYLVLFVFCSASLARGGFNPFIYFQF